MNHATNDVLHRAEIYKGRTGLERPDRHGSIPCGAGRFSFRSRFWWTGMIPTEPTVVEGMKLRVFAKDQPEYMPLPTAIDAEGCVVSEWEPTSEELHWLLCGGRIRLAVYTFDPQIGEPGHELLPVSLDVLPPQAGVRES